MRIMALDLGTKRVGVALSDELHITANGLTVLDRKPHAKFLEKIGELVKEHEVGLIVLGMPTRMDGTFGPESQRTMAMVYELKKHIGIEIDTLDERLSTVAAERVLLEADVSRKKRKQVIDKVAATYILQNYLDKLGTTLE